MGFPGFLSMLRKATCLAPLCAIDSSCDLIWMDVDMMIDLMLGVSIS